MIKEMMNRIYIFVLALVCLGLFLPEMALADSRAEIFPENISEADTLDLGITMVNRPVFVSFMLKNTGTTKLRMNDIDPSFFLGRIGSSDDFREFERLGASIIDLDPGESIRLVINYKAMPIATYPLGKKFALLRLGLFDPDKYTIPTEEQLTAFREYVITCTKTNRPLELYSDEVRLDSIYVRPIDTARSAVRIQNADTTDHEVIAQAFSYLSPLPVGEEIRIDTPAVPFVFPANRTIRSWALAYYPLDTQKDSAFLVVRYRPDALNFPDSTIELRTKIIGTGVLQDFRIRETDCTISSDTLSLGDVPVGSSKEFYALFANRGNIPFGSISQSVLKNYSNDTDDNYLITRKLRSDAAHIRPGESDTLRFEFAPHERGEFVSRLVIRSDIGNRAIRGYNQSVKQIVYYLVGRAVEPVISLAVDTVDFGNIVIHSECPTYRDSSILVANTGNYALRVSDIVLEPPPPGPFSTDLSNMNIPPGEVAKLKIRFSTDGQPIGVDFFSRLTFVSNSRWPADSFKIYLKARGVQPSTAELKLQHFRRRPGTPVEYSLISEAKKLALAKNFASNLIYDPTLLRYRSYSTVGAASEGAESVIITEDTALGKLSVRIKMPEGASSYFLMRDTLIRLNFDTYLGEAIETPIAFSSPEFGDGVCSKILTTIPTNGLFTLDSVCGLEFKAVKRGKPNFELRAPRPMPARESITISFNLAESGFVRVRIYTATGELAGEVVNSELPSGDYTLDYNCSSLAPGLYFCEFSNGTFRSVREWVVAR